VLRAVGQTIMFFIGCVRLIGCLHLFVIYLFLFDEEVREYACYPTHWNALFPKLDAKT